MSKCDGTHDVTTCWSCALIRMAKSEERVEEVENLYLRLTENFDAQKAKREEAEADVGYLLPRARQAGSCSFVPDRADGISSNALVAQAYGSLGPNIGEFPADDYDLAACERAFRGLPEHRRTKDVLSTLEHYRASVEAKK